MTNILYIGDPTSIHDIKWISAFSTRMGYTAYMAAQDIEVEKMTDLDRDRLSSNNITLIPGLRFYSLWRQWDNWHSASIIEKAIKEHNINIVHILFITPYALNANYTHLPTIITSRGSDALLVLPSLLETKGLRGLHDRFLFKLFRKALLRASCITCTSIEQQKSLRTLFGKKVSTELIRTGVDVQTIAEVDQDNGPIRKVEGKKLILFPRYIQPIYNTLFQIEALKLIDPDKLEKLQLVFIIGRNPDHDYLKKVTSELAKLKAQYDLVEYLGQQELWALYCTSDITVMTPISDGTPNSGLEAMAAKSQLIMGNLPYDRDLFNSGSCLLMNTDDPQELADLIMDAVEKPDHDLLESAFRTVSEKGDRIKEMDRLDDVYRNCLSSNLSQNS